jgi:hypothetical protein
MSKGVVKNSALTFILLLMVAMLVAVLLEHQHERRRKTIADGGWAISAPGRSPG